VEAAKLAEIDRVARMLERDRAPAPPKKHKGPKQPIVAGIDPTPEWKLRYENACRKDSPTTASGFKMAARPVYRKHPWFESLCAREDAFTDEDLIALRFYRNLHEATERSETKCSLASMVHGSGPWNGEPSLAVARAKSALAGLDPLIGPLIDTLRAIALEDLTYEQVAMARFGYRYDDYFDKASGAFIQRMRPKSGRHPGQIKGEFIDAAKRLTAAVNRRQIGRAASGGLTAAQPVQFSLTDTLRADIDKRAAAGRPVGSIDMPLAFLRDICRENQLPRPDDSTEAATFDGIHVRVFADRFLGWVLNDVGGE
jgi:hypothetical protein